MLLYIAQLKSLYNQLCIYLEVVHEGTFSYTLDLVNSSFRDPFFELVNRRKILGIEKTVSTPSCISSGFGHFILVEYEIFLCK